MNRPDTIQERLARSRRLPWLVVLSAWAVLAAAILLTTQVLRQKIREQMAGRDGEVMHAVALMHAEAIADELAELGDLSDPGNQLLVLLQTSRLNHVLGARLFDAAGRFVESFPPSVTETGLAEADLARLRRQKPVSHFHEAVLWQELFLPDDTQAPVSKTGLPVLEVNVPLHQVDRDGIVGVAQYLVEGNSLALEFARLDGHLFLLASIAFLVAGSLISITFVGGFRRLRRAQDLLAERTRDLLQANQELTLAAKTSALGAVTAHLIHGLKNPLSGLQNFVSGLGRTELPAAGEEWQQAVASARRMQSLINQVVQVLREQNGSHQYEITLGELLEMVVGQVDPLARQRRVSLSSQATGDAVLTNREANLMVLILVNLVQNALEASPADSRVFLQAHADPSRTLTFEVRDAGSGFPPELKEHLFSPCPSTKEGGSGLGLAISKLLATHLQASLDLVESGSGGCLFRLRLPLHRPGAQSEMASAPGVG